MMSYSTFYHDPYFQSYSSFYHDPYFQLRWLADPRSKKRRDFLESVEAVYLDMDEPPQMMTAEPLKEEPYSLLENGTYLCNFCGKTYKQFGSLEKHLGTNHEIKDFVNFFCKKCNKLFDSRKKLSRHENMKSDCSK